MIQIGRATHLKGGIVYEELVEKSADFIGDILLKKAVALSARIKSVRVMTLVNINFYTHTNLQISFLSIYADAAENARDLRKYERTKTNVKLCKTSS